jgi:hypothetical protein
LLSGGISFLQAKEPEMVESPLPYGWSFAHDLDHREQNHQLQSESAIGVPLDKQSSIHVQGRLSESPEVRERLERLVSESTKVISMLLASLVSVPLLLDFMAAYVMQ